MTYLYRYEAKGIQRWILDSNRLRDLAGGSALIEDLTERAKDAVGAIEGARVLYAAAGGLLAEFPGRVELERFASEWPMLVAYDAPGLHVVQAWVDRGTVADPIAELRGRLLPARRNRISAPLLEAGPWLERAGRSGLPAVPPPGDLPPTKARQTHWDAPSVAKERARRRSRAVFGGLVPREEVQADIERWPEGPIAVVHADGTGVGRRIAELGGELDALERFSRGLAQATRSATEEALEHLRAAQGDGKIRVRPIVLGGDDMTAIVPAAHARRFVSAWLTAFERATTAELRAGLHAGAGVAIVNWGYPFSMAYDAAERACAEAKKDAPGVSALRLVRITTALAGDDESVTWPLDQLGVLEALVEAVRALPRGTLRAWLALVDSGGSGERDALWARAREVAVPDAWTAFEAALERAGAPGGLTADGRTPVRDALALAHVEQNVKRAGKGGR